MTPKSAQNILSNALKVGRTGEGLPVTARFSEGAGGKKAPFSPPDWAERAAILEHDAGLTRAGAEARAAREAGFSGAAEWGQAVAARWIERIHEAQPSAEAGRLIVADALRMIEAHGAALALAGWGEFDLFGLAKGGVHGLAPRLKGGALIRINDGAIDYWAGPPGHARRRMIYEACDFGAGARPFWEVR